MPDRISTAAPHVLDSSTVAMVFREEQAEWAMDAIERSDRSKHSLIPIWDEVVANYMVAGSNRGAGITWNHLGSPIFQAGEPFDGSFLKGPETNMAIDQLASQGIALLMPLLEYIQALPFGSDDPEKARFLAKLLESVLQAPGNYGTNFLGFKDAFMLGTSVLEVGWETRRRMQATPVPVFDETGQFLIGSEIRHMPVTHQDMPLLNMVDAYDSFPDPDGTRIQINMGFFGKRFRTTAQEARRMAETEPVPVYNFPGGVEEAIELHGERTSGLPHSRAKEGIGISPFRELMRSESTAMVGFEVWGDYTGTTLPEGETRNRVVTVLEGAGVRGNKNPFIDGNIPFQEITLNPVSGRFWGLSPGEVIRFLQDSADGLMMVYQDTADLAARAPVLVGQQFRGDIDQLARRAPNDTIRCFNPEAVKPMPVDVSALSIVGQELVRRQQKVLDAAGATLPQQLSQIDRPVATGISEITRLSTQRIDQQVQLVERENYPFLGRMLHSRMRQFLNDERQDILAGERFGVKLSQIDMEADIKFVGSRQAGSQFQTAAQWREAMRVIGEQQLMIITMPEIPIRYLRDGLGIKDAEPIINEARERIMQTPQLLQTLMAGFGGGGTPAAANNQLSGTVAGTTSQEGVALA